MRKLLVVLTLISQTVTAQVLLNGNANKRVANATELYFNDQTLDIPAYLKFESAIPFSKFDSWFKQEFSLNKSYNFNLTKEVTDKLGQKHYKLQQYYMGVPIEGNVLVLHSVDGNIFSFNGKVNNNLGKINLNGFLSEKEALSHALKHIGAEEYRWEHEEKLPNGKGLNFFPVAQKVIVETKPASKVFKFVYKFDIYSVKPLDRSYVYVDANTGDIVKVVSRICHKGGTAHVHDSEDHSHKEHNKNEKTTIDASGTAFTRYSGTQSITTDDFGGEYRLRESGRNIETYDMNTGTNYSAAVDFTSTNNVWNVTTNYDDAAYDAHWGAEITYDYYLNEHGWDSYDGNGATIKSYIHYSTGYDNAFWDGERMTYGDGSNSSGGFTPLTAIDVVGHEITHGVTEFTSGLIYVGESGALNEAFSDIFGTIIEFEGKPADADWDIGGEVMYDGGALRSMSNPNLYNNPDTYEGDFWDPFEGVHTNSGVADFWFYLLVEGGTGTNDNSDAYSVTGIGMAKAADICYRAMTVYLTPTSDYATARYYTIKSAIDLYGACTPEVEAVTDAWYAVGVGDEYVPVVVADFTAPQRLFCEIPASVSFTNQTSNGGTYVWDFGDGSPVSTDENPTHTYTSFGTYTVTLSADGGACGTDDITMTDFIEVSSTATCITTIPATGTGATQLACDGILYDDGGPSANYSNSSSGSITIAPTNAAAVSLEVTDFAYESGFDYLILYDGPSVNSPVIGTYTGTSLPEGGDPIFSTSGAITVQQYTDGSVTDAGFSANWTCVDASDGPIAAFEGSPTTTCDGVVEFSDMSINSPISWLWTFGDGTTSTDQNPTKTYSSDGIYDVKLKVCNANECDSLTKTNYVTVSLGAQCDVIIPQSGSGETQLSCEGTIKDSGGDDDYQNGTSGSVTIAPTGAIAVELNFTSFSFESGWDYLYVYDGPNSSSPLLGAFTGYSLPGGGTVTSTGPSITLVQLTDGSVVSSGFECDWACTDTPGSGGSGTTVPTSGTSTVTNCSGTAKDNGGDSDYSNSTFGALTIQPTGATSITLSFSSFNFETGYDYLHIYDGNSTSSPLIGSYTGSALPEGGVVTSSGGAITLVQDTDFSLTESGFECAWTCSGVNSVEADQLNISKIYPNPATDVVNVESYGNSGSTIKLQVRDILQNLVLETEILLTDGSAVFSFDVSKLAAGMYFVRLGEEQQIHKLIVD